jgi:hypothetical protein
MAGFRDSGTSALVTTRRPRLENYVEEFSEEHVGESDNISKDGDRVPHVRSYFGEEEQDQQVDFFARLLRRSN